MDSKTNILHLAADATFLESLQNWLREVTGRNAGSATKQLQSGHPGEHRLDEVVHSQLGGAVSVKFHAEPFQIGQRSVPVIGQLQWAQRGEEKVHFGELVKIGQLANGGHVEGLLERK